MADKLIMEIDIDNTAVTGLKSELAALVAWSEDDFHSVNGQIEYLLMECVRQRRKNGRYVSTELDKPLEIDLSDTSKK